MPARKRSQERPVSYWLDFFVFLAVITAVSLAVLLLPGCGERKDRPAVERGCDFADDDIWEC